MTTKCTEKKEIVLYRITEYNVCLVVRLWSAYGLTNFPYFPSVKKIGTFVVINMVLKNGLVTIV